MRFVHPEIQLGVMDEGRITQKANEYDVVYGMAALVPRVLPRAAAVGPLSVHSTVHVTACATNK